MKDKIIIGLLALSIIFNIVNFVRSERHHDHAAKENENTAAAAHDSATIANIEAKQKIEPGDVMTKLQRNMNKLWFAGNNQNWPLATFYVDEIEEAMHDIADNNVVDEGIALSPLMATMGLKPLEDLESVTKSQNSVKFKSQYMTQIQNCNNCHVTAKHEFVVIKEPTTPAYDNQVYTKK